MLSSAYVQKNRWRLVPNVTVYGKTVDSYRDFLSAGKLHFGL
jgi:hypothetical protein